MKVEYINPFVESAIHVLKEFIPDIEVKIGKLSVKESPVITLGVATYVGITGDLKGRVIYDMDKQTAVKIASLMNDEEFPGLNGMVRATISELANIITGQATTRLSQLGLQFDITPPSLFYGENVEVDDSMNPHYLIIPLETSAGNMILNVALKEKNEK